MDTNSSTAPQALGNARDQVRANLRQNSALNRDYVAMNTLSAVVASYGLLENSAAVVIGAMIIATLLGPIMGIALALVDGDNSLLRMSFIAELAGSVIVLIVAIAIGYVHREIPLTDEILSRTKPNILDLMIALGGGAAGAYATVAPRLSVGLVGVAIATALVPPLAVCGICLAHGSTSLAFGGFLLFVTNMVAIQFAASVVLWLHGYRFLVDQRADRRRYIGRIAVSTTTLAVLAVVLGLNLTRSVEREQAEAKTRTSLIHSLDAFPGVFLADVRFVQGGVRSIVYAVVRAPNSITPAQVARIEAALPDLDGTRPELHVRSILTKEATPQGYLNEKKAGAQRDAQPDAMGDGN